MTTYSTIEFIANGVAGIDAVRLRSADFSWKGDWVAADKGRRLLFAPDDPSFWPLSIEVRRREKRKVAPFAVNVEVNADTAGASREIDELTAKAERLRDLLVACKELAGEIGKAGRVRGLP